MLQAASGTTLQCTVGLRRRLEQAQVSGPPGCVPGFKRAVIVSCLREDFEALNLISAPHTDALARVDLFFILSLCASNYPTR